MNIWRHQGKYKVLPLLLFTLLLCSLLPFNPQQTSAKNDCGYTGPEPTGIPVCNIDGFPLNYKLWNDIGVRAYMKGELEDIPGNDFKPNHQPANSYELIKGKGLYSESGEYVGASEDGPAGEGEFRYHGFDYFGIRLANDHFPADAYIKNDDLTKKNWIHKPWDYSYITDGFKYILYDLKATEAIVPYNEYLQEHLIRGKNVDFINGINLPEAESDSFDSKNWTPANNLDPTEYLYSYQIPDLRSVGAGIMWHMFGGKRWYMTFAMPKIKSRIQTPIDLEITTLDEEPINLGHYAGQSTIPVKVKVVATLKDEEYVGNPANEFVYYTRKDFDEWTITIDGQSQKVRRVDNTGTAEFTIQVPVDKIDFSDKSYITTATATAHYFNGDEGKGDGSKEIEFVDYGGTFFAYQSLFTMREYVEFLETSTLQANQMDYRDASAGEINQYKIEITHTSGESQTFSYPATNFSESSVQRDLFSFIKPYFSEEVVYSKKQEGFTVEQTITTFDGKTDKYTRTIDYIQLPLEEGVEDLPVYVHPNLHIPKNGFDIVEVSMSDRTDMSKISSRTCYVDGHPVSPSRLFGGNYIFGKGEHGLHQIRCDYTSTTGEDSSQIEWINIWNTKPRAQVKVFGSFKENRKMFIDNTSEAANSPYVLNHFPITSYHWEITTIDGQPLKFAKNTNLTKEFLTNSPGKYRVTITATNSLGRTSDPYFTEFQILKDIPPNVILHPYDSDIARGESVDIQYDAVSVDGDRVGIQKVQIFYDRNNDGTYNQLVDTIDPTDGFTQYTPNQNKVGKYKLVATVEEVFGEETIPSLLDGTEKRVSTVETWFKVDNYQPIAAVYSDIPMVLPEIDTYFMLDQSLTHSKTNYMKSNRIEISNMMRDEYMDARVETWDLKTYTYSTTVSKIKHTGSSYPPYRTYYSSGGYSGTLYLDDVRNNSYWVDEGEYKTRTESRYFSDTCSNTVTIRYRDGYYVSQSDTRVCPSSKYINQDGYSGSIPRTGTSKLSTSCYPSSSDPDRTCYEYWRAYYSGTLSKTETYWEENWVEYDDYTGYYRGVVHKRIQENKDTSFFRTTSDKYIVYLSDQRVNHKWDLQNVMNEIDAHLILVGQEEMKSQISYDYFILNNKPIEEIMQDVAQYIADHNPEIPKYYTLVNQPINLYFAQNDVERDSFIKDETLYIHDANYYDNSHGQADFAVSSYDESFYEPATKINRFSKVGKYTIMRRIQDQPSTNPAFREYNYYSNEAKIDIYVHRKPIAKASLDWDYDHSQGLYKTTWVDQSYDKDHQHSDPEKGIVERKIKYKKTYESNWHYKIPDQLTPGSYLLEYVVKDMEGQWSDPFVMNFTLPRTPDVQIDAKAKTKLKRFSMSSIPVSEQVQLYDVWTRYPYNIHLEVAMYQNGTRRTPVKKIFYSSSTGSKNGNDIQWNDIIYKIPSTLADGTYQLRITGVGRWGMSSYKEFNVQVKTPIDLQITDFPTNMVKGQTYDIKGKTSKYVNDVKVNLYASTMYQTTVHLNGTQSANDKDWISQHTVKEDLDGRSWCYPYPQCMPPPEGLYTAEYIATTTNGETQRKTVKYKITDNRPPIADFRVQPAVVYQGDTIKVINSASDPDGDLLTYHYTLTNPRGDTFTSTSPVPFWTLHQIGTYTLEQRVTDTKGASNTVSKTIQVKSLTLSGGVHHTPKWNENRKKYNLAKTGTSQSPRGYHVFFPGEKFVLKAETTNMDYSSSTYAKSVHVKIVGTPYSTQLTRNGNHQWEGSMWDESMIYWKSQSLVFRFTVTYSNGVTKTDQYTVFINDDPYWRQHRKQ